MTPRIARTSLAVAALMCATSVAAFAQTVPAAPVTVPVAADAAAQSATPTVAQPQTADPATVAQLDHAFDAVSRVLSADTLTRIDELEREWTGTDTNYVR